MSSHYEMLGVDRKASARAVQRAYERKMKALARNPDPLQERIVKDAFAVLSNPVKRADYDSRLGESDLMPAGAGSGAPLLVGLVVVALTASGIGYFLYERSKERKAMSLEEQRLEREKAKQKPPAPESRQPARR
jgi:DnaJ-class molecular chaperone